MSNFIISFEKKLPKSWTIKAKQDLLLNFIYRFLKSKMHFVYYMQWTFVGFLLQFWNTLNLLHYSLGALQIILPITLLQLINPVIYNYLYSSFAVSSGLNFHYWIKLPFHIVAWWFLIYQWPKFQISLTLTEALEEKRIFGSGKPNYWHTKSYILN